jgi:hypothetical protein
MADVIFMLVSIGFFVAAWAYVLGCGHLLEQRNGS